ncbi:hypothetical protein [Polyangium jinanense]|uniref:Uncharacterized protein n=1 Tax=Polyangium jinanense TaxID=2829994 RepID=A0A9X3WX31_9BACT|nr:hypothetical protein [Polyangium jinanense]MDC3953182.1 hypothetical protein [Polyangium jinanense]MDC3979697.1 hypothetical protein [Polyangium jinanense]
MLTATERKTLAWSAFLAGVLCLIPGETPRGPRIWDYARQVLLDRLLEHRATQIAWVIAALILIHHVWRSRTEAGSTPGDATPAEESARTGGA